MIRTPGFHGYSVKFCHTSAEKIALVGGTNFGLAGKSVIVDNEVSHFDEVFYHFKEMGPFLFWKLTEPICKY